MKFQGLFLDDLAKPKEYELALARRRATPTSEATLKTKLVWMRGGRAMALPKTAKICRTFDLSLVIASLAFCLRQAHRQLKLSQQHLIVRKKTPKGQTSHLMTRKKTVMIRTLTVRKKKMIRTIAVYPRNNGRMTSRATNKIHVRRNVPKKNKQEKEVGLAGVVDGPERRHPLLKLLLRLRQSIL